MTSPALVRSGDLKRLRYFDLASMRNAEERGSWKWVYFAEDHTTDLVKIGSTDDINRRLGELKVANRNVRMRFGIRAPTYTERALHVLLAEWRDYREWFHVTDEVNALIELFADADVASGRVDPLFSADQIDLIVNMWAKELP